MSVNDDGGLEVLIPDPDEDGMYYKLNMSSREDGTMAVWAEEPTTRPGSMQRRTGTTATGRVLWIPVEQRARGTKGALTSPRRTEGDGGEGATGRGALERRRRRGREGGGKGGLAGGPSGDSP